MSFEFIVNLIGLKQWLWLQNTSFCHEKPAGKVRLTNRSGCKALCHISCQKSILARLFDHQKSSDLFTFNTPISRYKSLYMPFGILSATKVIEKNLIKGFQGAQIILDDMLVAGKTVQEYDETFRKVKMNF